MTTALFEREPHVVQSEPRRDEAPAAAVVRAGLDAPTQWGHEDQQQQPLLPRRYLAVSDPDARRDTT